MNGEARRDEIVRMLTESSSPLAGVTLAKHFDVSRQVIVQDIALLRANGFDIFLHKSRLSDAGADGDNPCI